MTRAKDICLEFGLVEYTIFQPVTDPNDPVSQNIFRQAVRKVADARLYPMPKRKHRYDHRIGSEYRARNLADFLSKTNLDKKQSIKAIKLMKALELLVSDPSRETEIIPSEDNIAQYLGFSDNTKDLKQFHQFCGDYQRVRRKWASDIELADKQYNYMFDLNDLYRVYKVIQNAAIGSVLGLFGNIEHYEANLAVTAGTGAALTAYNETIGKRTMNLPAIWGSTFVGGLIGSFFGDDQTGKYIGAGVGAGLSTVYEVIKSLKRRKKPLRLEEELEEEISKQIDDDYIESVEDLIIQYAT